ncbi:unnamed protein product [Caretta caretta]
MPSEFFLQVGSRCTYCWGLRKGLKFVLAESERLRGKAWLTAGKASHALRPEVNVMQPLAEGICLTVQEMDHSHRKNGLHLPGKVSTSRMLTWDENFRSSSHSIQDKWVYTSSFWEINMRITDSLPPLNPNLASTYIDPGPASSYTWFHWTIHGFKRSTDMQEVTGPGG